MASHAFLLLEWLWPAFEKLLDLELVEDPYGMFSFIRAFVSLRTFDRLTVSPFGFERKLVRILSCNEFEQKEIALISF